MASSVIYSASSYKKKIYPKNNSKYPYFDWLLKKNNEPVIFNFSEHYCLDTCKYTTFIPDCDGQSGYLLVQIIDNDYTYIDICCRFLVHFEKKDLYISDMNVDYECIFWGCESKYTGRFKAFKRLEDGNKLLNNAINKIFGPEWRYHLRFTKRHQQNLKKKLEKKLLQTTNILPKDVNIIIVNNACFWKDKIKTVDKNDIQRIENIVNNNIGAKNDAGWGKIIAWNDVVAVYNPILNI